MRLIARKVYRAFPELDRFTDEHCQRFVAAVNRRSVRRAMRIIVVAVALLLAGAVGFYVATRIFYRHDGLLKRWASPWWLVDTLHLTLPFLVAGFCGLVTRDLVIRLQIRAVIRVRGTCLKCGYSLLGIRVVQNRVVCPECGTPAEADAALGELVIGDGGGVIFNPVMNAEVIAKRVRRRVRWRKIRRAVLVGAGVLILSGGVSYTIWWYQVQREAERAAAARDLDTQLAAWQARNRLAGVPAGAENSWSELAAIVGRFSATEGKLKAPQWGNDYATLLENMDELSGWNIRWYPQGTEEAKASAMLGLSTHRAGGTVQDLCALAARRPLLLQRPIDVSLPGNPFMTGWSAELIGVRTCGAMCMAQAHIAMRDGDDKLALDSIRAAVLSLEAIEQDPAMFSPGVARELRVGIAAVLISGARQIRDAKVLRELSVEAERLGNVLPHTERLEAARFQSLDVIRWFYSEPQLVRRSVVMGPRLAAMGAWMQDKNYRPTWVRSRESAEAEVNGMYREAARRAQLPAATVATLPGIGATQSVVNTFVQDPYRFVYCEDPVLLRRRIRLIRLTLAVEAFQREHGYYPAWLRELVPTEIEAEALSDPATGKPFSYSPWDLAKQGPPTVTIVQP